jgi:hypothetical protein
MSLSPTAIPRLNLGTYKARNLIGSRLSSNGVKSIPEELLGASTTISSHTYTLSFKSKVLSSFILKNIKLSGTR